MAAPAKNIASYGSLVSNFSPIEPSFQSGPADPPPAVTGSSLPIFLSHHSAAAAPQNSARSVAVEKALPPPFATDIFVSTELPCIEPIPKVSSSIPWKPIYDHLANSLLPLFPSGDTEMGLYHGVVGIRKLAARLYAQGFTKVFSKYSEDDGCIFLGEQDGKKKKIKICSSEKFQLLESCLVSHDLIRGEACAIHYLSDVPELVKVESSFGIYIGNSAQKSSCVYYILIGPYVTGKDLAYWIPRVQFPRDLLVVLGWIEQLLSTIQKIHARHCSHRDPKPENIIVDRESCLKWIDQDFMIYHGESGMALSPRGTFQYCSQNRLISRFWWKKEYHAPSEDLHAVGIMIYELCSKMQFGVNPRGSGYYNFNEFYKYMENSWIPQRDEISEHDFRTAGIPEDLIPSLVSLVVGLTESDPQKKMSVGEGLEIIQKVKAQAEQLFSSNVSGSHVEAPAAPPSDCSVVVKAAVPLTEDPAQT